jgi:gliding motility-associated-like protein
MKRILSILFLICFFIAKDSIVLAQCSAISAADICANAPDICDLNGYCGSTSGYTSDFPTGMSCSYSIENNSYIKFTAVQSTVSITATVPNCSSTLSGVQMVILQTADCSTFTTVSNCGLIGLGNTETITASGLTPGQVYYVMMDGNSGAVCDYSMVSATGVGTCCPVQPNAGPDVEICKGDSTTLTATGGISFLWTPGNFTTQSIKVSPSATTKYTVAVSNGSCSVKDSVVVTVNALPTVDAGTANSICYGDTLTLNSTANSNLTINTPLTFNNPVRYPIDNQDTIFSPIQVSGISGAINASSVVSVCFNITHPNDADLDIFLFCPDGTRLELSTDNGGTSDNYTGTCFTSSSTQNITSVLAPFTGNYKPEGTGGLAGFSGCSSNGTWKLGVYDDASGSVGSINDWSLTINNSLPDNLINYTWSPSTTLSNPSINNPEVFPTTTTTYYLTVANSKNCTGNDSVKVIVNPLPMVNAGNDTAVCSGNSFNLHGSGADTYQWSPTTGLNNSALANPTATITSDTKFYLTGTSIDGCIKTDSVMISVNSFPAIDAGADVTICSLDSVQLNATGGTQYTWTPAAGLSNNNIADPKASPATTTTFTVTSNNLGCVATDSVIVNINTSLAVNAGTDVTICYGDSVQLNASGGAQFNWSPAAGLSNSTITNPFAKPLATTTYTITSNTFGCTGTDSVTVIVNHIIPNAGNDTAICRGINVQLNASGGTSYSWLPATGLSSTNISNPQASPLSTIVYTVTVTSGQCSENDSVIILIHQPPVINASNDTTLCLGDSVNLIATGGISYSWFPTEGLNNAHISNPIAGPGYTNAYTVTGTDVNGCKSTEAVTIKVNPLPIVNAGNDATICLGGSVSLNATGGNSLLWTPAAGLSSTIVSSPVATPTLTTSYVVTATSVNGCIDTDTVKVIVNNSTLNATNTSVNSTCFGSNNGSAGISVSGGTGVYNYYWFPGAYTVANVSNLAAGTYTVTITDPVTSCKDTSIVTINQPADFVLNMSSTNATCNNSNGSATVSVTGSSTYTYSWSTLPVQNLQTASNLMPGQYTVTVSDAASCVKTDSVIVWSIDNLSAEFTSSVISGYAPLNVSFINNSNGATTYLWSFGDSELSNLDDPSHSYLNSGIYTVQLIASNASCMDTAEATIYVYVEEVLQYILPNVFTPNGDLKNDIFTLNGSGMKSFEGKIFNRWGKKLYEWTDQKGGWDGENQPDGIYYYTVEFDTNSGEHRSLNGFINLIR